MRDGMRLAIGIGRVFELQVGVVEKREDALGLHGHILRAGKQLFLGIAQNVPALMEHDVKRATIQLEVRTAGVEAFDLLVIEFQDLRCKPARGARNVGVDGDDLRGVILICGVARILVELTLRIVHELAELDANLVARAQVGEQVFGRGGYLAPVCRQNLRILARFIKRTKKRLVIRVDAGEVPAIALVDLVTGFVCHGFTAFLS